MTRGVRIRGPFTGPSGYDHHVREFIRALVHLGAPIALENLPGWGPVQLPHHLRDPWYESLPASIDERAAVHFCFPPQVIPSSSRLDVNFTMFEATRIPHQWVEAHERADLVIVPTEHSRAAWVRSGVPESKLRLCPLGVRSDLYRPGVRPLALGEARGRPIADYRTRFLNISELSARKNLGGLLGAWLRATTSEDDAVLIMKVGCYNPGSLAAFENLLAGTEARAGKRLDQAAPVHLVYDLYPDADMPRFFAAATHYVSLSFGEGWDLPMIEAAATDLRLIAPRHSAYVSYLDDSVATFVSAREQPALNETGSWAGELFVDARWWVPDEEEAIAHIRAAIDGAEVPKASAREWVSERYTWARAATRLLEIIDEALKGR